MCGLSIGGMTSMWLASGAPERVDRLALCCTSAYMGPPEPWLERAALVRRRGTAAVVDAAVERWFTPEGAARRPDAVARMRRGLEDMPDEGYAAGCQAHAALERPTAFTADFQDLITRYAWGEIWARPGLDRRTRSAITLTALVAAGRMDELAMHVRAALRNGLSPDEIKEVLLQTAVYCGVPAANAAFAVAQRVLEESDA